METLVRELLRLIVINAPTLIPEAKRVIDDWRKVTTDAHRSQLIEHIKNDVFGAIDSDIDKKIDGLDIPEK
jgi:hypothetical protein